MSMLNTDNSSEYGNPKKSKCVHFTAAGGIHGIYIREETIRELKETEVRVAIKYAGVNFIDILQKFGLYPQSIARFFSSFVPGCEASGVIEAVGSKVNSTESLMEKGCSYNFKVGDRVTVYRPGGLYRETINCDPKYVLKIPQIMSLQEASCLALNYLTAYDMLFKMARLKKGDVVLMPQVAGGVGTAVAQLCKSVEDVKLIGLCSQSKHKVVKDMGVDHVIDYRTHDYVKEVKTLYPKGVDIILDGLNGEHSSKFFDMLKPFGILICYGTASAMGGDGYFIVKMAKLLWNSLNTSSLKILTTNKAIGGYHLGRLADVDYTEALDTWQRLFELYTKKVCE
ncbi:hypothetical protein ACOME3_001204 [Neoechinorhynchus agilis]